MEYLSYYEVARDQHSIAKLSREFQCFPVLVRRVEVQESFVFRQSYELGWEARCIREDVVVYICG